MGQGVLCGQQSFSGGSVTFSLGILLECIGHGDGSVAQVLSIHGIHCSIGCFEAGKVDKGESLGVARLRVSHDLWSLQDDTECGEGVVEEFLIHLSVQIADKDVCAHVQVLLVGRGFVDTDWFAVQLYHVHDLYRVVCILLGQELDESVTLVHLRYSVLGHVNVDWKGEVSEGR